jgi:hypothetical protein
MTQNSSEGSSIAAASPISFIRLCCNYYETGHIRRDAALNWYNRALQEYGNAEKQRPLERLCLLDLGWLHAQLGTDTVTMVKCLDAAMDEQASPFVQAQVLAAKGRAICSKDNLKSEQGAAARVNLRTILLPTPTTENPGARGRCEVQELYLFCAELLIASALRARGVPDENADWQKLCDAIERVRSLFDASSDERVAVLPYLRRYYELGVEACLAKGDPYWAAQFVWASRNEEGTDREAELRRRDKTQRGVGQNGLRRLERRRPAIHACRRPATCRGGTAARIGDVGRQTAQRGSVGSALLE